MLPACLFACLPSHAHPHPHAQAEGQPHSGARDQLPARQLLRAVLLCAAAGEGLASWCDHAAGASTWTCMAWFRG